MKNFLFLAILILFICQLKAQTIEIGQDAEQVKRLVSWKVRDYNKPDSYGNFPLALARMDISYSNGQIVDVVLCYKKQYNIDLNITINYCNHYVMECGKLSYILTQYENVSKEKLIEVYNSLYEERKINNLYFDKEYKHYSKIYLAENGLATIELRKAELYKIPSSIRKEIENKQKAIEDEKNQEKNAEAKEEQKRLEITSKLYDLETYNKAAYSSVLSSIKQGIFNYYNNSTETSFYYDRCYVPSFDDLSNGSKKKYRYKNSFNVYCKLEDNSQAGQMIGNVLVAGSRDIHQVKEITNISGNDNKSSLFDAISFTIPTIKVDGYEVMTEARFENISVDYAKGITIVKIKNGNVNFVKYVPDDDLIDKLTQKLKREPNGKYIIKYTIADICGEKSINTENEKLTSTALSVLKTIGYITFVAGLLALTAL